MLARAKIKKMTKQIKKKRRPVVKQIFKLSLSEQKKVDRLLKASSNFLHTTKPSEPNPGFHPSAPIGTFTDIYR